MKDEVLDVRHKMLQVLEEVMEQGWEPEDIFLFGFSQGCLISADVALHFPHRLAGVVGVSGYFHFFPQWKRKVSARTRQTPWLLTHGSRDTTLPIEVTKFGVRKLERAGISVNFVEMNKGHVLKENEYPLIRKWVKERLNQISSR